ncbi:MAG TPA: hypothetical protein VFN20_11515, partial [Candidatus Acidoferrum sp.]|nr:hypothetical protein [Candidatus Acidoferrum sp.]
MSSNRLISIRMLFVFWSALSLLGAAETVRAQGCVAARSNQGIMDELCGGGTASTLAANRDPAWLRRLTVNVGFREFNSFRHFVGTDEQTQRERLHNQIENHQLIFDVGINYQLSRRWSILVDVPVLQGSRNQVYSPVGVFRIGGIGDMQAGVQSWLFRPPTESNGNVAVSSSLKIPTGICDGTGSALYKGQIVKAVADQSLQPGDCRWGFTLATQAYREIWFRTMLYFQGSWLFNPADTNGVPTFRGGAGEGVMSVTDQYLFRGGFSHGVAGVRHLSFSFGGRMEGIPVRDAFGSSNGFRRPGYIISID